MIGKMKHLKDPQSEIDYWQSKFRILKDWKIRYQPDEKYKREVCHSFKNKKAGITDWGRGRPAKDYIFHEMLHICQCEISNTKEYYDRRELEELYIQDLSLIFRKIFNESDIEKLVDKK